jgi:hypothetical protein
MKRRPAARRHPLSPGALAGLGALCLVAYGLCFWWVIV